VLCRA